MTMFSLSAVNHHRWFFAGMAYSATAERCRI
jgi:hypothetical protein